MWTPRTYWLLIGFLMLAPARGWADFTADQLLTDVREGKRDTVSSKIYSQGRKTRVEIQIPGRHSVRIAREDKSPPTVWTLFPEEHSYLEFHEKNKKQPEKDFLGIETLEGHLCNKYRVRLMGPEGPYSGLQWEAVDLDRTPIRQEYQKGSRIIVIELKNIQVRPLDASLFEIPPGYHKLEPLPR